MHGKLLIVKSIIMLFPSMRVCVIVTRMPSVVLPSRVPAVMLEVVDDAKNNSF